jgi:hypothetical protein
VEINLVGNCVGKTCYVSGLQSRARAVSVSGKQSGNG